MMEMVDELNLVSRIIYKWRRGGPINYYKRNDIWSCAYNVNHFRRLIFMHTMEILWFAPYIDELIGFEKLHINSY